MADNVNFPLTGTGDADAICATDQLSGDSSHVQLIGIIPGPANTTPSERIGGDAANGLDVDVTRLPAIPAGNNNIGDVDVASIAAGDNNIGNVDVVTLPAIPAGNNNIGDVDVASIAAGDNNIGNVDIVTMPAVDINSLPNEGQQTMANSISVAIASNQSALSVAPSSNVPDATASGTIAATAQEVILDLAGKKSAALLVTGSFTGTINLTYSYDGGVTYTFGATFVIKGGATVSASSITAAGTLIFLMLGGVTHIRARGAGWSAGTATLAFRGVEAQEPGYHFPAALNQTTFVWDSIYQDVVAPGAAANGLIVRDTAQKLDDAAFTPATDNVLMAGFEFDDASPDSVNEGDAGAARMSANRNIYMNIRDAGGGERGAGVVDETGSSAVDALAMGGGTPHDSVNSGNPLLQGMEAIAHGTNPTAVAAADRTKLYANRAGVPFVIGGHPNVITYGMSLTTAVSNTIIGPTIGTSLKLVVTRITVVLDNASTVFPTVTIGFGASTTPAFATTPGTAQVLLGHPAMPAGGGMTVGDGSGIIGIGADGEELRITTVGNAGGAGIYVTFSGYTIES